MRYAIIGFGRIGHAIAGASLGARAWPFRPAIIFSRARCTDRRLRELELWR
ncbi:hypothetical protein [Rhizobium sp. GCM10022189]|jgi:hypothetical protein|uniref:hypothetical protein n=1 Tax=Rhizobium sp. GCM10022189 TaxID=3252654 RepID=UPI00360B7327